jgi:23S rRNA pseudouridine2605 synthase
MMRLNKYLAHAGIASRRQSDEFIANGRVKVDGMIVRDLGTKIDPNIHKVAVDDHVIKTEKYVYWIVNKPIGTICTNYDPAGRPRAIDLVPKVEQRVYTVGRLDEGSEGLLLLTNDGDLAEKLMHPRYGVEKTYEVQVAGNPTKEDLDQLLEGVWIAEGKVKAKSYRKLKGQGESTWLRIVLCEGKNREIRRMLAKLHHKVMKLKRIAFGPIKLERLAKGKARKLNGVEIEMLRNAIKAPSSDIEESETE